MRLVEINETNACEIPLSPVQVDGDKLPIEQLFSSVVIKEDPWETRKKYKTRKNTEKQEQTEVKTPEDLLTKNGKPVRNIFMIGDAAHGKTTYCLWLLKMWCNSMQPCVNERSLNEWEKALSQFDFVFHLPLRHVDPSRASVIDMICQDILGRDTALQNVAKHVLFDDNYRCFIVIDGLDEWKPDQSALVQLKYKGMPNIDNMANCVVFTTMRSWMFSEMVGFVSKDDRVVEIKGLDDKGIEDVIEKVLSHYFELKPNTSQYKAKLAELTTKMRDNTMRSFIKIPLLAVICVQIWYYGKQLEDSKTSFYVVMINMLIQRAHTKHNTQNKLFEAHDLELPKLLSLKKNIRSYFQVLFKLGKVAYEDLLSDRMKLVFSKDNLEKEIGESELRFALDVGLISQRGAHGVTEELVSVNFFHKSIQEFLAALYMVTENQIIGSFCKHLSNVKVILELSNVIMFVCGMCPPFGSDISQRVASVTDSDVEFSEYRGKINPPKFATVLELYAHQVSWYRELKNRENHDPVPFHVSDVSLNNFDNEKIGIAKELFSDPLVTMRSLKLFYISTDRKDYIPDEQSRNFLAEENKTRNLVMLYIRCHKADVRSVHKICGSSVRMITLGTVRIQQCYFDIAICPPLLTNMTQLRKLHLWDVDLGNRLLGLTPDMVHLERIHFIQVRMSSECWRIFISSLIKIKHEYEVYMKDVDIDQESYEFITSSRHFSALPCHDSIPDRHPMFIRVWPLT